MAGHDACFSCNWSWTAANTSGSTSAGTGIGEPVLRRDIAAETARRGCMGRLRWARSRGRRGSWRVLPNAAVPMIGRMLQDAPDHTPIPYGPARARHLARLGEPPTDLANRQAVAADPGKDLADHAGFVGDDFIAGLAPPSFSDIAVAIGRAAEHIDRTKPGGMALATPVPLDDLGPFILRHHPLHLEQQIIFWALARGAVEEDDLDARAAELIDQQDLIGIFAGQAIGRVDIEPVHTARATTSRRRSSAGRTSVAPL